MFLKFWSISASTLLYLKKACIGPFSAWSKEIGDVCTQANPWLPARIEPGPHWWEASVYPTTSCNLSNTRDSVSSHFQTQGRKLKIWRAAEHFLTKFDAFGNVMKHCLECLSRVFDISSQSKLNLRSKRRNENGPIWTRVTCKIHDLDGMNKWKMCSCLSQITQTRFSESQTTGVKPSGIHRSWV